tara:strand:+ start:491 stop:934 length:444 start_codon:yes stop_codon:yes gene_type:complete
MNQTPFVNPRGGYFTMNDRGRLVAEKKHNPNNVHKGERYYSRQGPMGNPRMAGYDNGNTRVPNTMPPIGGPFVPFGGMDYTGKNTGMRMASMDPGSKYNGTYKQPGYADPRFDDFGQEEYYDNRDYYMDDVIDPGLSGYDRGPLYFS